MSTERGKEAESQAAHYLESLNMTIIAQNWRNRWCEIDIIALDRDRGIHFVEVKYRHSSDFGSGFEYITRDKTNRLRRAAVAWMALQNRDNAFQIDVIAVEGELNNSKIEYLPNAVTG